LNLNKKKPILPRKKINGLAQFVATVREMDPKFRKELLAKLSEKAPHLVRLSELTHFIFDDIQRLEKKSIQKVLSVVDERQLLLAWKLAGDQTKEALLKCMSERRKKAFEQELATQPKALKANVYKAQQAIANQVRVMLEKGELSMSSKRMKARLAE